jgi:hypothetical protein
LRKYCEGRVPQAVIDRSKQGFPTPLYSWYPGALGDAMRRALLGPDSWVGSKFSRSVLSDIANNAQRSSFDGDRFWLLYVLELWARRWL